MAKAKAEERIVARRLRRDEGMPMKGIAKRLGVSPSSVHLWTSDIELTPAQRRKNWPGQPPAILVEGRRRRAREVRLEYQQGGRSRP